MNRYKLLNLVSNVTVFFLFLITAFFVFTRNNIKILNSIYGIVFLVLNILQVLMFAVIGFMFAVFEKGTKSYHSIAKAVISFFVYFVISILIIISMAVR